MFFCTVTHIQKYLELLVRSKSISSIIRINFASGMYCSRFPKFEVLYMFGCEVLRCPTYIVKCFMLFYFRLFKSLLYMSYGIVIYNASIFSFTCFIQFEDSIACNAIIFDHTVQLRLHRIFCQLYVFKRYLYIAFILNFGLNLYQILS